MLSGPQSDATVDAGAGTPTMLRRWPSKSNGVLPSRGSQDGGAEAYPVRRGFSIDRARLADEWGLVRERFGPVHDFTFGVATGRPASGETSDGRAVRPPHCWTGGASCEVVGGRSFPPYARCPRPGSDHPPPVAWPLVRQATSTKSCPLPQLAGVAPLGSVDRPLSVPVALPGSREPTGWQHSIEIHLIAESRVQIRR